MSQHFAVRYRAPNGEIAIAEVPAISAEAAGAQIAAQGQTPLSARPLRRAQTGASDLLATRIARELAMMLAAGMTLPDALSALSRHGAQARSRSLAAGLLADVRGGRSLAEAFAARPSDFPQPFAAIAEAGEASGTLAQALADLAEHREQWRALSDSVRAALVYPAILLCVAVLAVGAIFTVVVPRIRQVFVDSATPPPPSAAFVFALADIGVWAGPLLAIVIGALVLTWPWLSRQAGGRAALDQFWLTNPLSRAALRTLTAARYCRVLAVLLKAGVSSAPALKLAGAALPNAYAAARLGAAFQDVRRGADIAAGLERADVLPPLAAEMLRVGEATGDLGPSAARLAQLYETQFKRGAEGAMRLAEPVLVLICGVIVGGVVIAMALALASLNEVNF
jgi:general secretion pathway protein F